VLLADYVLDQLANVTDVSLETTFVLQPRIGFPSSRNATAA
jgi:hypothetical protein